MMVGSTWNAKIDPSEVSGVPSLPNRTDVPAAGRAQHLRDHAACPEHRSLSEVETQHEECEQDLETQTPRHRAPADVLAIR